MFKTRHIIRTAVSDHKDKNRLDTIRSNYIRLRAHNTVVNEKISGKKYTKLPPEANNSLFMRNLYFCLAFAVWCVCALTLNKLGLDVFTCRTQLWFADRNTILYLKGINKIIDAMSEIQRWIFVTEECLSILTVASCKTFDAIRE